MFFYASLFVAIVFAAFIVLYLYRILARAGHSFYGTILPSSKNIRTNQSKTSELGKNINRTQTPWGWESRSPLAGPARPQPTVNPQKTPWGWKGNGAENRERGTSNQSENTPGFEAFLKNSSSGFKSETAKQPTVGWPYRAEKSELDGKSYTVSRQTTSKKTNPKNTRTPWGW